MGDWEQILRELAETDMRHGGFIQSALDEIESLRQQLAAAQEELHFQACLTRDLMPYQERALKSERQLAAALAACEERAKALNWYKPMMPIEHQDRINRILAIKPDDSALKAHDAQLLTKYNIKP